MTPRRMAAKTLKRLRQQLPTLFPVKLFWVPDLKGDLADCDLKDFRKDRPYFVIRMSHLDHDSAHLAWHSVVHEYAHALSWTRVHRNLKDHGPLFGAAYSLCYMATEGRY